MPNHKSAAKRDRQNVKRREVNRSNRSALRTQIKKLRKAMSLGHNDEAKDFLTPTLSLIDKSVNKGILHKNTAARYKSRLTKHVNGLA